MLTLRFTCPMMGQEFPQLCNSMYSNPEDSGALAYRLIQAWGSLSARLLPTVSGLGLS